MTETLVSSSQEIQTLENENERSYYPEPITDADAVPDMKLYNKSGYLFYRSRALLIHHWSRCFVSIESESGKLLINLPGEYDSTCLMNLTSNDAYAGSVDIDDRRWVFEILCKKDKKHAYFQCESQKDRDEWIATVCNVAQMHQSLSPNISTPNSPVPESSHHKSSTNTPIRQSDIQQLEQTPIQFDLSSPTEEYPPLPKWLGGNSTVRANPFGEEAETSAQMENLSVKGESSFAHTYSLRFVGSVRIVPDPNKGNVIDHDVHETIQHILAARAIHGIFRMSDVNMLIASDGIYLLDSSVSSVKARFPLHRIVYSTVHNENDRLFAFVSSSVDIPEELTCHVFESNVSAKCIAETLKIVEQMNDEIGAAAVITSLNEGHTEESSTDVQCPANSENLKSDND